MTAVHSPAPEELMAYLDGELPAPESRDIQAHLAACETCQQLAGDLRRASRDMRSWQVDEPPVSLRVPPSPADQAGATAWRRLPGQMFVLASSRAWRTVHTRAFVVSTAAAVVLVTGLVILLQPARKPQAVRAIDRSAELVEPPAQFASARGGAATGSNAGNSAARSGSPDRDMPESIAAMQTPEVPSRVPLIERTVRLRISTTQFDAVRPAIDRILQGVGGFAGRIDASDAGDAPRSIRATLRIPSARVDEAVAALRKLGRVTDESQNADDVTEQVVDLHARIANGRITEKRLNDLVQTRTGRVSDVLETEREIARVRTEIEQLDAQRKNLDRRVTYATVVLEVFEARRADVNLGPIPIPTRLRLAVTDGIETAVSSVVGSVLVLLRAGPAVLVWAGLLGVPGWLIVRHRRRAIPDR